jgi:ribosomal RNA-processing protein 12
MKCLLAEKEEVHAASALSMKAILQQCIAPNLDAVKSLLEATPEGTKSPIHKMFATVEGGLSYQYHASWGQVLQTLAVFFAVLGKSCHKMMHKVSVLE